MKVIIDLAAWARRLWRAWRQLQHDAYYDALEMGEITIREKDKETRR